MMQILPVVATLASAAVPGPEGPYTTGFKQYKVPQLDAAGGHQKMDVYYPTDAQPGETFPLISYSHSMLGGSFGPVAYQRVLYGKLFPQLASHGFILVCPEDCNADGCGDKVNAPYTDCAGLPPVSPDGWASYYGEQLKSIEWARNQTELGDEIFSMLDVDAGVGIAGHSMGGQATALSSHFACTEKWNIKAAALHHSANGDTPIGNLGVNISVPLAAFGSTGDASCTAETKAMFEQSTAYPKIFRNEKGFSHLEPMTLNYNPPIATMTAAWFKVHLKGDESDYYNLIFDESASTSFCNYAEMEECRIEHNSTVMV